jgi:hypothetical protein
MTIRRHALLLGTVTALAACADVSAPDDDVVLNADLAVVAADAALDGLAVMQDPGMSLGRSFDRARTITFFDAAGAEQDRYDALTTASIRFTFDLSVAAERGPWSAAIERHRELIVSGLAGAETTRTWNGSGTESITRSRMSDENGTRTYDLEGEFTVANVVVPVPGSEARWPLSGTISHHWLVTRTSASGDVTRERTVVITFDGTQTATAVVDGETFEIDLSTRRGILPIPRLRYDGRGRK